MEHIVHASGVVVGQIERRGIVASLIVHFAKMTERYRRFRNRLADTATLHGMSDRDLKDIGVYRCDIDRVVREDCRDQLMDGFGRSGAVLLVAAPSGPRR